MQTIIADNIAAAHEAVVKLIMDGHEDVNDLTTEDNELTFEYPTPVNIHPVSDKTFLVAFGIPLIVSDIIPFGELR